jgi:hypothetical protein
VLDGAGNPVTDTRVTLEGWNADRTRLRSDGSAPAGGHHFGGTETRRVDDLGRFRFPDLAPGEYRIETKRAGSATIRKTVALAEADVVDLVFIYDEGPIITIKVQDDRGRPVEGVFLTVSWPGVANGGSARTDVEGTASFRAPAGVGPGRLHVHLMGKLYLSPEPQELRPGSGTTVITLARAATVEGQVVDVAGKGLPGMRMASLRQGVVVGVSVSDSEGRFSLSLEFGDPVDLELTGKRYPVGPNPGPGEVTPLRGRLAGVIPPAQGVVLTALEDPRNRSLTVLVVDRSGAPLDGVLVSCSPLWFTLSGGGQGRTNDAGRVLLENLGWESVDLSAELPSDTTDASPAVVRVIPNGQVITLRGRPATVIGGWVLLPDGTPAIGAYVSISKPGVDDARVKADGVGRFTARVAAGHAYDITAWDPDGGTTLRGYARDVRGGNRVTIRLEQTRD